MLTSHQKTKTRRFSRIRRWTALASVLTALGVNSGGHPSPSPLWNSPSIPPPGVLPPFTCGGAKVRGAASAPAPLPWQRGPNNQGWHVNYGYYGMKTVPRRGRRAFLLGRTSVSEVKRRRQHNSFQNAARRRVPRRDAKAPSSENNKDVSGPQALANPEPGDVIDHSGGSTDQSSQSGLAAPR